MPFIIQQCILPLTMTTSSLSVGCCFCIILRPQNIGQSISQLRFADVPLDQTSEMDPPPLLSGLMAFLSGILPGIRGGFPYCLGFSDLSNVMLRGIATPYPLLQYFILPLKLEYKSIPTKILFTCPWTRKHILVPWMKGWCTIYLGWQRKGKVIKQVNVHIEIIWTFTFYQIWI